MITLQNVVKTYGTRTVIRGVSLTVKKGITFGFLGQNGAGKTTTMKMLVGLAHPSAGEIAIDGRPVSASATREHLGYMPEAPYFYDRLSGLEFMQFCGELFERHPATSGAYEAILARVGLREAARRPIATYSKGMKQRLGFAQALVNEPEYIFLDEPLDGLDPLGRREMKVIIQQLHAEGRTIFFNSHILYDTEALCDEVGIIHDGELIAHGSVAEICAGQPLEERFVEIVESRRVAKQL